MKKSSEQLTSRQLKSIQTRNNLLESGREIFLTYGFQKATISQIIKEANTGYGTAYVHFKNKDDILIILMEDVMNHFYEIAESPFEPKSSTEAYDIIYNQVSSFLKMGIKEQAMMQVVEEAIRLSDEIRKKWEAIRERFIERIALDIDYAQRNGLVRMDVDQIFVARGWFFSNEMYLWEIVKSKDSFSLEDIVHNLTAVYTRGLYINEGH